MGNSVHKEGFRLKEQKVVQIMRIDDGKILEFRNNPTLVKDVLTNYPNSYIGYFNGATQPLPCHYKLKIGKMYYLLPCPNKQEEQVEVKDANSKSISRRIKVVITKEQLQELLDLKNSTNFEESLLLLGGSQGSTLGLMEGDDNITSSSSSSTWLPKLPTIHEGCDDFVSY